MSQLTLTGDERRQIRRAMRQRRRQLSAREQGLAARGLTQTLRQTPEFRHAKRVGLYLANDGEIDPSSLASLLRQRGKTVYLPVLHPVLHNRLWFAPWQAEDALIKNRFGIPEPDIRQYRPVASWTLDVVLMPLVAFDHVGGRLGMGGGFFDRCFAWKRSAWGKAHTRPKLIGIAHDFQETTTLPTEAWDVPLDAVATERRFLRLKRYITR